MFDEASSSSRLMLVPREMEGAGGAEEMPVGF